MRLRPREGAEVAMSCFYALGTSWVLVSITGPSEVPNDSRGCPAMMGCGDRLLSWVLCKGACLPKEMWIPRRPQIACPVAFLAIYTLATPTSVSLAPSSLLYV